MTDNAEKDEKSPIGIPKELPILPVRGVVIFPGMAMPLEVGRYSSVKMVEEAAAKKQLIGVLAQKDAAVENPGTKELYPIGTVCRIVRFLKQPSGRQMLIVHGLSRFLVKDWRQTDPYFVASIEPLKSGDEKTREIEAQTVNVKKLATRIVQLSPGIPEEVGSALQQIQDPGVLIDLVAGTLNIDAPRKQEILETLDLGGRFEKVTRILTNQLDLLELSDKIQSQVKESIDKTQREIFLREQLRAIRGELGEMDDRRTEREEFEKKIATAEMPPEAEEEARRQLKRLDSIPQAAPEYSVVRTYLEWLTDLPWSRSTEDCLDIIRAGKLLDQDHYDLDQVKKRILEYLAVRKLRADARGPILCFVGPPGTGKTSLGRSIARALGRKFVRLSLGGIRDEAAIRGHRRTYIGALPGRIIQGIRTAGSSNPVFMLDEVDKIGTDFRGDPSSALLEVLDPEQNFSFSDHYLEVPFDLSRVMFITTANILDTIPPPLRDRMEVLELPGYTEEEKVSIARRFLLPRQLKEHGLTSKNLSLNAAALRKIISAYTREAGLRNLERNIAAVCRQVARTIAEGGDGKKETVTSENLAKFLGPGRFYPEVAERTSPPGVATGLAWTPAGGEIIFVEATRMPGKGNLLLTGQLGEVMKESAQAALSYLRSQSKRFGLSDDYFSQCDLHIHVPAGAIRKDGPSAGVAIFCALASLVTGQPVRSDLAMTGEITLRGQVLPVGGIKEKVLAARRAGIKIVILPDKNRNDLTEVPKSAKKGLGFRFIKRMDEAVKLALKKI